MNAAVPLRKQELPLSSNEQTFIRTAIADGLRIDGRAPFELRELRIQCCRATQVSFMVGLWPRGSSLRIRPAPALCCTTPNSRTST